MFSKDCLKRGEKQMSWLSELKVAIISKDPQKISDLIDAMPKFEKVEQMQEALFLIKEAYIMMNELKSQTLTQREQIKKNIDFLESTAAQQKNSLDVSY